MIRLVALLAVLVLTAPQAVRAVPAHDISVRIDPHARVLQGRDTIRLDAPGPVTLVLSGRFRVSALSVDGAKVRLPEPSGAAADRPAFRAAY